LGAIQKAVHVRLTTWKLAVRHVDGSLVPSVPLTPPPTLPAPPPSAEPPLPAAPEVIAPRVEPERTPDELGLATLGAEIVSLRRTAVWFLGYQALLTAVLIAAFVYLAVRS
jgi:hypothetical protein